MSAVTLPQNWKKPVKQVICSSLAVAALICAKYLPCLLSQSTATIHIQWTLRPPLQDSQAYSCLQVRAHPWDHLVNHQLLRNADIADSKRALLPKLLQAGTQVEFLVDDPRPGELDLNVEE